MLSQFLHPLTADNKVRAYLCSAYVLFISAAYLALSKMKCEVRGSEASATVLLP
jgi:hypothetical protein